jgi:catechol 2,3-dioxygenase-like lactoylglutathione lyase family enzyme
MRLDHVALATRDASAALATLIGSLGATALSGGHGVGFRPMQVHLGDGRSGMKLELLEPWAVERNDFLERFVSRHGDGPHHLTFKVDDLAATLERVEAAGLHPVSVDLSDPIWREAFLQPKEAHGTVVQLAESSSPLKSAFAEYAVAVEHGTSGEPVWWTEPELRAPEPVFLRRIVLAAPAVDTASAFFGGVLDGETVATGEGWVELGWPGGGRIRLEERPDRPPGIDRLELEGPGPTREVVVAGARLVVNPVGANRAS